MSTPEKSSGDRSRGPAPATELNRRTLVVSSALEELNALSPAEAKARFLSCCGSSEWARQEQSGTRGADPETLADLSKLNREYADRFGRVFLVCATGRSAAEMLALGRKRLENVAETELAIAAEEQRKITRLRLEKLLSPTER